MSEGNESGVVGKIVAANGSPVATARPAPAARPPSDEERAFRDAAVLAALPHMLGLCTLQRASGVARPDGTQDLQIGVDAPRAVSMAMQCGHVAMTMRRQAIELEATPSGAGGSGGGA